MKKLLLLAASACLFAVSANAQLRYGPEIGLNINKFDYEFDNQNIDLDESTNIGLRIGAAMDICIAKHLTLQPGIYYSAKGGERDFFDVLGNKYEESVDIGYIEIPLILNYYFDAGPGRIFVGLGPTAAIGVNADLKQTITASNGGVLENEDDIDFGSEPGQLDRTDIGLMFNLGYDFDMGLFIRPFVNWGLSDLSNDTNFAVHNRTFGLGVGWWFGDDF